VLGVKLSGGTTWNMEFGTDAQIEQVKVADASAPIIMAMAVETP
jgi:thiazole synthase ThiGH ThiG subunit